MEKLSAVLTVPIRELLPYDAKADRSVVTLTGPANVCSPEAEGYRSGYGVIRPLAHSGLVPRARAFEINLSAGQKREQGARWETYGLHHYGYVLEGENVLLEWDVDGEMASQILGYGDSFYMKPWTPHSLRAGHDRGPCRLLSFRAPGAAGGDAFRELGMLGADASRRMLGSQEKWYD